MLTPYFHSQVQQLNTVCVLDNPECSYSMLAIAIFLSVLRRIMPIKMEYFDVLPVTMK